MLGKEEESFVFLLKVVSGQKFDYSEFVRRLVEFWQFLLAYYDYDYNYDYSYSYFYVFARPFSFALSHFSSQQFLLFVIANLVKNKGDIENNQNVIRK